MPQASRRIRVGDSVAGIVSPVRIYCIQPKIRGRVRKEKRIPNPTMAEVRPGFNPAIEARAPAVTMGGMAVSNKESAKSAITFFEKIDENKKFTLLKINIPTGRTHQIRVHLSSIGFPIHGDEKYGGKPFERVLLHAEKIKFLDPDNEGKFIEVIAPAPEGFTLD